MIYGIIAIMTDWFGVSTENKESPKPLALHNDKKIKKYNPKGVVPEQLKPYAITKENAVSMANRMWDIRRAKAAEGMQEAVQEHIARFDKDGRIPVNTPLDAYKQVIKHATGVFMNKNDTHITELGYFITRASGMIKEVGEKNSEAENGELMFKPEEAQVINQIFIFMENNKDKVKAIQDEIIDAQIKER
jgi:cation diffusion facilitator CzcD-associated flavoprotein CzcO